MKIAIGVVLGLIVLWLIARQVIAAKNRIAGAEAHERVRAGAVLLDVRTAAEYAQNRIEGAVNIPVSELRTRIGEIPKDSAVVVYCHSGMRSSAAARVLRRAGYEAHDLGPRSAW